MVALLESLAAHPELVRQAGALGREALLRHYDLPIGVGRICEILGVRAPAWEDETPAVANSGGWEPPLVKRTLIPTGSRCCWPYRQTLGRFANLDGELFAEGAESRLQLVEPGGVPEI
jgi:hypothetical protein